MSYSSCLAEVTNDLILDSSVFISLSASGAAEDILRALPQRSFMADIAASEVRIDNRTGRSDCDTLRSLAGSPELALVKLDGDDLALFEKLVAALDDGEAATIAAAIRQQFVVVLDERKARRVCVEQFSRTPLASTVDLFAHPEVSKRLGPDRLADAIYAALQKARMHVRADQRDWIVDLIGTDRAAGCKSIPRKARDP